MIGPTVKIEWPQAAATNMVVHVRNQDAIKVDGLEWTAPKHCYVIRIHLLDRAGNLLWTSWLHKGVVAGTVIQMPSAPTIVSGDQI